MTDAPADQSVALIEGHVSAPDAESARRIAEELVGQGYAACVQVLGPMASVYRWEGEVHRSTEYLLLLKTTDEAFPSVVETVRRHHRYDVPEVIAVPVVNALAEYGQWVADHSVGSEVRVEEPQEGGDDS